MLGHSSKNDGKPLSQVVRFRTEDLLKATNQMTSGLGNEALKVVLERHAGPRISTNLVTGGLICWEKKAVNYLASLQLACAYYTLKQIPVSG